jgi:uncharacterized membrane protein
MGRRQLQEAIAADRGMKEYLPPLIFVLLSVAVSGLAHKFIKSFLLAVTTSTIFVTIAYQAMGYVLLGYLDPFFVIAMVFSALCAALIAAVVGLPFAYGRRKK